MKANSIFLFSIIILLLTSRSYSAEYILGFNPALSEHMLSSTETETLSKILSDSTNKIIIKNFDIPEKRTEYFKQRYGMQKKDFRANFLKLKADIGIVSTYEYLDIKSQNADITPLMTFSLKNPSKGKCSQDVQIIVLESSPIKRISDLKNKKLGFLEANDNNLFPQKIFLKKTPLNGTSRVIIKTPNELREKLKNRTIDAAVDTFSEFTQIEIREGFFKNEIFTDYKTAKTKATHRFILRTNENYPCGIVFINKNIDPYIRNNIRDRLKKYVSENSENNLLNLMGLDDDFSNKHIDSIENSLKY